ncbi:hypothetical protein T4E_4820 [Trichinella pseudospiralis]|uniref:Uncharacterized protein n=1 Tax=Trichinella pseudospiralis TaxID=6337 RepID=A0A0V0XM43_TRIPS|nr:hypothetical protein T4E_4820 [Trichinella pseudospiralis]
MLCGTEFHHQINATLFALIKYLDQLVDEKKASNKHVNLVINNAFRAPLTICTVRRGQRRDAITADLLAV